jgi:hypothetical protein
MLDIKHLYTTIKDDFATDIKVGDFVISTNLYDSSVFVADPLTKTKMKTTSAVVDGVKVKKRELTTIPLLNPYTERVIKREESRLNLTVRVKNKTEEEEGYDELRLKVKKLCLLDWDEETQSYPRQSVDIIFRQRNINFAEHYADDIRYCEVSLQRGWLPNDDAKAFVKESLNTLKTLASIPPFLAFCDRKYGFLIKRSLAINRIVMPYTKPDGKKSLEKVIQENIAVLEGQAQKKIGDAVNLKEAICMEKYKPERVERAVKKAGGWDEYEAEVKEVVGYGKAKN